METKQAIPLHATGTIHIPHHRRQQKRSLQHPRKILLQHALLQQPPLHAAPDADAHTPRKSPGTLDANYARQNSGQRLNFVRRQLNLRHHRHSSATHERHPQPRKKKQKHRAGVQQDDQPPRQRLPHNRPTTQA